MWLVEIELAAQRSLRERGYVSRREPLSPTLSHKGRGSALPAWTDGRFLRRVGPGSRFTWPGRRRDEVPLPTKKLLHDAIQRRVILLARGVVRVRRGRVVRWGMGVVVAARCVQSLFNQVAQGVAERVAAARIARAVASIARTATRSKKPAPHFLQLGISRI